MATCPSCEERIDFGAAVPTDGRCAGCGCRFLAVAPEIADDAAAAEVEVMLVATGGVDSGTAPLPRPVWQLVRLALAALATLFLALVLFMVVALATRGETSAMALVVVVPLGIAFVAVFAAALLWLLLGSKMWHSGSIDVVRSMFAITSGFATMLATGVVLGATWWAAQSVAPTAQSVVPLLGWALLTIFATGTTGGWVIARLARVAPYRHAIAAGLAIPLAFAFVGMLSGSLSATAASFIYAAYLPALLTGAWLAARGRGPDEGISLA